MKEQTMTTELKRHIVALAKSAQIHDRECSPEDGFCASNRWYMMACLMVQLDLDIADLGHIGEALIDIQCAIEDCNEVPDDILNAKEIE
jgi:hypothetical protein